MINDIFFKFISIFVFVFLFLISKNAFTQIPPTIPDGKEFETNIRFNVKKDKWSYFSEVKYRHEVDSRKYQSIRIGSYYRIHRNFKIGAFYQRQYGERHEEDWRARPFWHWSDHHRHGEDIYILDGTARTLFGLNQENWVGEFKTRYFFNSYNQHSFLRIRPGLSYLWFYEGKLLANLYTRYETYIPLNYSKSFIYEWWWYLGALAHLSKEIKLGPFIARREVVWTDSTDFRLKKPNDHYQSRAKSWEFGLNFLFVFVLP